VESRRRYGGFFRDFAVLSDDNARLFRSLTWSSPWPGR